MLKWRLRERRKINEHMPLTGKTREGLIYYGGIK